MNEETIEKAVETYGGPGRCLVIGAPAGQPHREHIDYNGGSVLPIAIDLHHRGRRPIRCRRTLAGRNALDVGKNVIEIS